ncbi:formylglycine-generating enzyme family protein [Arthrobacter sp. ISL-95]|uniref:formylglycine-generating enzyme family protein n=1 Tax=Arthrobacter sp. ISL-95 TaxID=2819116 RepID=UPI001BE605BA|nr:formylglycine-generating enzyme family protein [Arthrobacter sp. ISL-95]MBT2586555.1 formylglycine-generating enzyme family protein [Arthrobacter sp. ISL-95]
MTASSPHRSCCAPYTASGDATLLHPSVGLLSSGGTPSEGKDTRHAGEDVVVPAGSFEMGDAFDEGYPADGETPVHPVAVSSFAVDATAVTNAQFAKFIEDSGYRTESEQLGSSAVFHLLVQAKEQDILGPLTGATWWLAVRGADWAHPNGPRSIWKDFAEHPVAHVSWNDAMAYCAWAGRRLLTEAEWEYAARGGLAGKRYAWGDELHPEDGQHRCNIWQGEFPLLNTEADGYLGTAPVGSFPPNGYGLHDTSGNVWEWCQDWFLPKYYRNSPINDPQGPTIGAGRVMRGGSYLCHDSYCNRYRVAARSYSPADSASGNCGFRTARSLT